MREERSLVCTGPNPSGSTSWMCEDASLRCSEMGVTFVSSSCSRRGLDEQIPKETVQLEAGAEGACPRLLVALYSAHFPFLQSRKTLGHVVTLTLQTSQARSRHFSNEH